MAETEGMRKVLLVQHIRRSMHGGTALSSVGGAAIAQRAVMMAFETEQLGSYVSAELAAQRHNIRRARGHVGGSADTSVFLATAERSSVF